VASKGFWRSWSCPGTDMGKNILSRENTSVRSLYREELGTFEEFREDPCSWSEKGFS
jgi:hypothetical protein